MAKVDSTSKSFYVYVHRRASDGRVFYVGKGSGSRSKSTQRNQHWKNIVAKHRYTIEIVQNNMLEWWAFELEIELIASYGRDNLANCTDGGDGCSGSIRSVETIAKTVAFHTGKKRSEESRKRMSNAQKSSINRPDVSGDKNPARREDVRSKMRKPRPSMCGDNNSMHKPEVKAKFLEIVKSESYKNKMSISCKLAFSDQGLRERLSIASKKSYSNPDRLEKARANMLRISSDKAIKEKILSSRKKFYEDSGKKVICVENGLIFSNQARAVDWLKKNVNEKSTSTRISNVIHGKRKTAYGFTWKYA